MDIKKTLQGLLAFTVVGSAVAAPVKTGKGTLPAQEDAITRPLQPPDAPALAEEKTNPEKAELLAFQLKYYGAGPEKAMQSWDDLWTALKGRRETKDEAGDAIYNRFSPKIAATLMTVAKHEEMNPKLFAKMALVESGGNPDNINTRSGAAGLFQFMPEVGEKLGLPKDERTDPIKATEAMAKLLQENSANLKRDLGRDPSAAELYLAHQQGHRTSLALIRAAGAEAKATEDYHHQLAQYLKHKPKDAPEAGIPDLGNINPGGVLGDAIPALPKADPNAPTPPEIPTAVEVVEKANPSVSAVKVITQNGGTEEMTAGEFVNHWKTLYNGIGESPLQRRNPSRPRAR